MSKLLEDEGPLVSFTQEEIDGALNHTGWIDPDLPPYEEWCELKRHQRLHPELYGLPELTEEQQEKMEEKLAPPGVYIRRNGKGRFVTYIWHPKVDGKVVRPYVGTFDTWKEARAAGIAKQSEMNVYPPAPSTAGGSVYQNRGKWQAYANHRYDRKYLGAYVTKEEALAALNNYKDKNARG